MYYLATVTICVLTSTWLTWFRAVARSENPGGHVVLDGDNVPTLVEIGLADLPKSGVGTAPRPPTCDGPDLIWIDTILELTPNGSSNLLSLIMTGLSQAGGPGGHVPPHFLADQLTLSQPGGAHYPRPVLCAPPDFQTLRRPWYQLMD